MSTISHNITNPGVNALRNDWAVIHWTHMTGNDEGQSAEFVPYADRSFQVSGIFGTGSARVILEGSNDGVNWSPLRDPFNEVLTFDEPGLRTVIDVAAYVRPRLIDGSDLSCALLVKY